MCPVRALRHYLQRTEKIWGTSSNLWCLVRNPSHSLLKNALSFFLRDLIREAHNISLSSIIQSTYWKCRSVFASHYFKDVETVFNDCSTLGPLSVAGKVLGEGS